MAMDILSVQATSVASESAFSTSGRVLSIRRTRLTLASLEMCMCLKDHLDAQERKQEKSTLETPVDFEEEILDADVQAMKPFHYPMKKLHLYPDPVREEKRLRLMMVMMSIMMITSCRL
nr:zinc finger BED domain-containing protein RICESLEEPER 2 [Tanacetum cinerariifolium]